jgi:hypothetical protein
MQPYKKGPRKFKLRRGRRRQVNDEHDNAQTDREMLERFLNDKTDLPATADQAFAEWYQNEFGYAPNPDLDASYRSGFEAGIRWNEAHRLEPESLPLNSEKQIAVDEAAAMRQYDEPDGNEWIFEEPIPERDPAAPDGYNDWLPAQPRQGKHARVDPQYGEPAYDPYSPHGNPPYQV